MEYIIGTLLYRATGSKPNIWGSQGLFSLPKARQAGRKEHATQCAASENLRKFKGKSKENSVTV